MTASEHHRTLGRFATVLASLSREESLTDRLCEAGRLMLDADGAAMTINYTGQDRLTVSSTDDLAWLIEDVQDVAGEGPGHDAANTGGLVSAHLSTRGDDRWNLLSERLRVVDIDTHVLAFPLTADRSMLGVMTVHRQQPTQDGDASLAKFLGVTVGSALLQDTRFGAHGDALTQAWSQRAQVHQATGMVVAQVGVRPEDALALLRGQAFARNTTLAVVADDIIARRINFRDFTIEGD